MSFPSLLRLFDLLNLGQIRWREAFLFKLDVRGRVRLLESLDIHNRPRPYMERPSISTSSRQIRKSIRRPLIDPELRPKERPQLEIGNVTPKGGLPPSGLLLFVVHYTIQV